MFRRERLSFFCKCAYFRIYFNRIVRKANKNVIAVVKSSIESVEKLHLLSWNRRVLASWRHCVFRVEAPVTFVTTAKWPWNPLSNLITLLKAISCVLRKSPQYLRLWSFYSINVRVSVIACPSVLTSKVFQKLALPSKSNIDRTHPCRMYFDILMEVGW
jgi:hypothetical protein